MYDLFIVGVFALQLIIVAICLRLLWHCGHMQARNNRLGKLADILEKQAALTDRRAANVEEKITSLAKNAPILPVVATAVQEAKSLAADTNSKVTEIRDHLPGNGK